MLFLNDSNKNLIWSFCSHFSTSAIKMQFSRQNINKKKFFWLRRKWNFLNVRWTTFKQLNLTLILRWEAPTIRPTFSMASLFYSCDLSRSFSKVPWGQIVFFFKFSQNPRHVFGVHSVPNDKISAKVKRGSKGFSLLEENATLWLKEDNKSFSGINQRRVFHRSGILEPPGNVGRLEMASIDFKIFLGVGHRCESPTDRSFGMSPI